MWFVQKQMIFRNLNIKYPKTKPSYADRKNEILQIHMNSPPIL